MTSEPCAIFLSYTRLKDRYQEVTGFREHFEYELRQKTGDISLKVFQDTEMDPGRVWRDELEDKLKSAKIFMILLSPTWLKSPECRKEFYFFKQLKATTPEKVLVPLVWDDPTHVRPNEDEQKDS
jgi:hypothetical protein